MNQLLEAIRALRRDLGPDLSPHIPHMHVTFDDQYVSLHSRGAGGRQEVRARFAWSAIRRICFKDNGPTASDLLYVFTHDRTKALAIPLEARGGGRFWRQLRERGLFPAELHERATLSMDGGFYCWPPLVQGAPQDA